MEYLVIIIFLVIVFFLQKIPRPGERRTKKTNLFFKRKKFNIDFIENYNIYDFSYNSFEIKKRDNTKRKINSPNQKLKNIQKNILLNLNKSYIFPDFVTAFRKNFSIKNNAKKHTNKRIVINIDVKDFFSSITTDKIRKRLEYYNFEETKIEKFLKIITYKNSLPQGAPTSPFIANFVFLPVDYVIIKLLKKYDKNVSYSRYADDLTFSSDNESIKNAIRIITDSILPKYGFEAKHKKTKIYRNHTKQLVTGLVVNEKVAYPRKKYMILRSMIFNFLDKNIGNINVIKGNLAFLKSVDKKKYKKLKKYYKKKFGKNFNYLELFKKSKQKKYKRSSFINPRTGERIFRENFENQKKVLETTKKIPKKTEKINFSKTKKEFIGKESEYKYKSVLENFDSKTKKDDLEF